MKKLPQRKYARGRASCSRRTKDRRVRAYLRRGRFVTTVDEHRTRLAEGYPATHNKPACHECGCAVKTSLGLDVVRGVFVCAQRMVAEEVGDERPRYVLPVNRHSIEAALRTGIDVQICRLAEVV